jgi:hypothetical protein
VKFSLSQPTLRPAQDLAGADSEVAELRALSLQSLCGCDLQQLAGISESKFGPGPFTRLAEAPAYLICRGEKEVATSLALKGNLTIIIVVIIIKCIS